MLRNDSSEKFIYLINKPDFTLFNQYTISLDSLDFAPLDGDAYVPFTKADSTTIMQQLKKLKKFRFTQKSIVGVKIFSNKNFKKSRLCYFKQDNSKLRSFIRFSVPIFFGDGNKAIFYHGGEAGGRLSVYKEINGKWIETRVITRWIS